MMRGWQRSDGRKGIRNVVAVAYLVECAHHVARQVAGIDPEAAHVIGFPGCFPNDYAQRMMERLCTHPNVGAVLLVSLGCESFNRYKLEQVVRDTGRPVKVLTIQNDGGTRATIAGGRAWVASQIAELAAQPTVPMAVNELVVGTVCGGSDGTSGITGNPAAGLAFDRLVAEGATCIFEETGELIGCEAIMETRAATPELAAELRQRRKGRALLRHAGLRVIRARQCRWRPVHHRGKIPWRLYEIRAIGHFGADQTRRHSAPWRAISYGCGA